MGCFVLFCLIGFCFGLFDWLVVNVGCLGLIVVGELVIVVGFGVMGFVGVGG